MARDFPSNENNLGSSRFEFRLSFTMKLLLFILGDASNTSTLGLFEEQGCKST
jgi:hypothetical protein